MEQKKAKTWSLKLDTVFLAIFLLLLGIGLINLLSASSAEASLYKKTPYFYFKAQCIRAGIGVGLIAIIYFLSYQTLRRLAPVALGASLVLLVMSFLPFFRIPEMETYRWMIIHGVYIQPSEFARVGVVFFMAWSLSRCGTLVEDFWYGFAPHFLLLVIFGMLIVLEKDLGGAVIVAGLIILMCFLSGMARGYFVAFFIMMVAAFWYYVVNYGYRMDRIMGWLDPFADPLGKGYVIIHSFFAFANGGIFGVGPGQSIEKLFFIPEVHTDLVFAVVGEELGLIGVVLVSLLFLALAIRGFMIARSASNLFDYYLASGASLIITLPAFVNIGVALSIWPAKGLALPFFSYGGSNMVASCIAIGLVLNCAKRSLKKGEERPDSLAPRLSFQEARANLNNET
ncbi:MAG: putative lipid II flippase FtsW [Deltaproteobacteria bacterium]|jgi:cell division protein FtsW|nr:putative lipid II flippase FtsW [Deltaproteobacteria bacterium]